jgi:hypothetical protein
VTGSYPALGRGTHAILALVASSTTACSYGLFQTAHTQPPGTVSATFGVTTVSNEIAEESGRNAFTNLGFEPSARVGLGRQLDVGVGGFFLSGGRADVKYDLLGPDEPLAIAPRFGVGYQVNYAIFMAEIGVLESYRVTRWFEPYGGLTLADHWIGDYDAPDSPPAGKTFADRTYSGDGLLKANLGVAFMPSSAVTLMLEYGHWFFLFDDPGDFYSFLPTDIFGAAIRFGRF